MKILYVSSLSSKAILHYLYSTSEIKPAYSIQKFHRLLAIGMVKNNAEVHVLSALPVSTTNHKRKFWGSRTESEDGITYKSIPFANLKVIRNICFFLYTFFYTFIWGLTDRKNKRIVCDALDISVCIAGLWASKLVGLKSAGIVTDMPGLMVGTRNKGLINRIITAINKSYFSFFSYYVLLTDQMNSVINIRRKPFVIMEGLVDVEMEDSPHANWQTMPIKNLMYAGGLHECYGVKMLLDAFKRTDFNDVSFSIYGLGPMSAQLDKYHKEDNRINFYGAVPNEKVVEEELKSALLINPRPTHEEFTKYSFPSKNMEYMVSGAAVLTTRLSGMPKEYYPYVFLFDEETEDGYYRKLNEILSLPIEALEKKGNSGKRFVLTQKNNVVQAKRVLDCIKK